MPETAELDTVLATMRRERTQMVVVIDEHGGTAGVVTLEDLFEEVVGEIDEGPTERRRPSTATPAAGCACRGRCASTSWGSSSTSTLEHEDVDSVSGLVLTLLGRPPRSATPSATIGCSSR